MTTARSSIIMSKSIWILSALCISNLGFAERNPKSSEACEQFKKSASKKPSDEITFQYSTTFPNIIYHTYYRGAGGEYYFSPENREAQKTKLIPRYDIFAIPSKHISQDEYQSFFVSCGIIPDEEMLPLGFLLVEAPGYDPVVAAKALEDSQWFDIVHPMFVAKPND